MRSSRARHLFTLPATIALAALFAAPLQAVAPEAGEPRAFDARVDYNAGFTASVSPAQEAAVAALSAARPELAATFDPATGVTRSLYNRTGYMSDPASAQVSVQGLALDFVARNLDALGLSAADVADFRVQDEARSGATGATHLYLTQEHQGLAVYNGQLQVHVNRDGRILSVNNAFVPDLASSVAGAQPSLSAAEAVLRAAFHLGLSPEDPQVTDLQGGAEQRTTLSAPDLSRDAIEARLAWLPIRRGDTRLVWNFQIQTLDSRHWYDFTVDAHSGGVWTRFDWVSAGTYRVYEQPVESPQHTTPLPPADARTLAVNPEEPVASPSGWFSGGVMDGNNVHACVDANANNVCDTPQASCSGTTCDFPINLAGQPSTYRPAAVTNLFYWNNIIHDVHYQYGFDEAAGNFQEDNFGRGGAGSDSVNADAQDGSGNCNANFATPPDGSNPRMQMFTCNAASPSRDGDLDNGVIVHEYGHGISNRLVGGRLNVGCLNNAQQPGEGWSDWFALAYTAEVGDAGTDQRGVGSYLFALAPDDTIRPQPYSTDPGINDYTYESISGLSIPHGVGSVWAQAAWEVYWALVDQHGFDPDLYDAAGGAGNQRAMLYVTEGLKNTACGPTFLDARDGIVQAATDNYGGADVCLVWDAFAAFGLGTDASTPGPNSTSATNGFSVPAACSGGGGNFQFGTETIDEIIRTVNLSGFTNPIVVMGPPSFNGAQPTTVRVRNVTASSFQHSLQEWDYLDGNHVNESIGYLVFEAGNSTVGSLDVEAGSVNIDHNWATVNFNQAFSSTPVVMAQVVTINGGQAVTTRIRNVGTGSFQVRLQEEEGNDGTHLIETVHYIAMEEGLFAGDAVTFLASRSGNVVTHAFTTVNFGRSVANPVLLADMQTFNGNNPAALRHQALTSSNVEMKVEEEESLDPEVNHIAEDVGFIVVGN